MLQTQEFSLLLK